VDNHRDAVALHYMHYNFCRVLHTLRITPAMEAGLTDHVWTVDELIALLLKPTVRPSTIDPELFRNVLGESARFPRLVGIVYLSHTIEIPLQQDGGIAF